MVGAADGTTAQGPIPPVDEEKEEKEDGTGEHQLELERAMTDTTEIDIITEALAVIDRGLGDMLHRELISTDEVADLLLDVRTLLSAPREPLVSN